MREEKKKEKEERDRTEESVRKKDREAMTRQLEQSTALVATMMTQLQNNQIQPIPQSIENSSERSALNISGITKDSQQIVVLSPAVVTKNALNRNCSTLVTSQPTAEDKIRSAKRIRSNESGDRSPSIRAA